MNDTTIRRGMEHVAKLGQLWDAAYAALTRRDLDGFDKHMAEFHRTQGDALTRLSFADLSVARYEPPSDAVDQVMDRNLIASSRIATMQRLVREEIQRRAEKLA